MLNIFHLGLQAIEKAVFHHLFLPIISSQKSENLRIPAPDSAFSLAPPTQFGNTTSFGQFGEEPGHQWGFSMCEQNGHVRGMISPINEGERIFFDGKQRGAQNHCNLGLMYHLPCTDPQIK